MDAGDSKADDETEAAAIADSLIEFREKGQIRVVRAELDGSERVLYP